ncbi:2-C-methyl-D-erythritol 2,4-cyclodiphosphate synthase [Marivirga atlantica]|jgi:2-C-methyl-D-erythritol 2,4-cyclodiphosphate synthase|uniref:2-C-methyl-D-erythritol 2,4-cyclodiphosphate synthase n=1 Tax=Marivirga atlantica TaxID=1548457 RepID=A0A937AD96_9BACT|nr:2-C-methyl-D-erythritol 2,4-cyclodiphosphate synthase [Marivirga atlantica]MBL0766856.1 2-C-methyl-D-erythritol 2,4-cyclodiphosphate synthase [Marivirga atlantica]
MQKIRIGYGYDVHQLADGEEFWLGGIKLDYHRGAVGHSDADVLIHVICDALLGAANLRDIGYHFPDTDPKYKGIDSKKLLAETTKIIRNVGFEIGNIDATVSLQKPKIKPVIPDMIKCLSEVMEIDKEDLSIKATTTEKLGFVGREEGVDAHAVVLIYKK